MSDFASRFSSNKGNSSNAQESSGGFADKYKKNNNMSASNIQKESKSELPEKKNNSNINQVDPQKRMQAELIYLVKGVDAGRNAWYYVLVDRLKVQLFLKALNDDIIHLEEYGKILFSAYGDEPPEEITGKLKDEYGII
ncbi:MAG: hypothetical protein ISQ34_01875 [Rickettsiales bacterium]|nr:hypothetical protein [Rickettsiales bacterium]